jgi:betaine reductase
MGENPVIQSFAYLLAHAPEFVRYGSKPRREIGLDPGLAEKIANHLRPFEEAVRYPPNQVFLGNLHPEDLAARPAPWWKNPVEEAKKDGAYGPFLDQTEFYGFLKAADLFDLIWFTPEFTALLVERIRNHPLVFPSDLANLGQGHPIEKIRFRIENEKSLPLYDGGELIGAIHRDHGDDEALQADVLLENLATKASGALAIRVLLQRSGVDPKTVDYILSCSEEAVGDRYQRGGGNLAKAVGEACGLINATGSDVKAFCAGPVYAIVHAGSLVKAGVFDRVIVFGGGCQCKLGMKFAGHLKHGMPILEDVLAGMAFLVTRDDGKSPVIRLESVGKHRIGDGSSQQEIFTSLVVRPLEKMGMKMTEVDKIATELHNPEVTLPQGSGNVPLNNYKLMAALAVMRKEIERGDMESFIAAHGMPGFSPTQGHIPAAMPYFGHAAEAMSAGKIKNSLFVAKGSLFLGRMSRLSDGLSFFLEKNTGLHVKTEKCN